MTNPPHLTPCPGDQRAEVQISSKILKHQPARRWLHAHTDPAHAILYVGIDAHDARRGPGIRAGWKPWTTEFPLLDEPGLTKEDMLAEARALGLRPPDAYAEGFSHANFIWTRLGRPDTTQVRSPSLQDETVSVSFL